MKSSGFSTLVFLLFLAVYTVGQTPGGYNPFVPVNLNDTTKIIETPVVESSIHRYWIYGDPNYTDTSTYIWYVENGAFINMDTLTDTWTPLVSKKLGKGSVIEMEGISLDTVKNASEIWVRWNENMGGDSTGYIAVYEKSAAGCILKDLISGYKHEIVLPPEVWFIVGNREECADKIYSVSVAFNNINDFSFPYLLGYTYPGSDGMPQTGELLVKSRAELDVSFSYKFDLLAVHDLNVTLDETYTVRLVKLSDKFQSQGIIAPLKPPKQFEELTLTIYHLPQTGGMTMDIP